MFETILIGTSGLLTHSKGLRIVGNNLANVNTPGFKGSQLEFASLVEQGAGHGLAGDAGSSGLGHGLTSTGTHISFRAGVDQVTGSPLDLSIDGNGFYTVKREGRLLYTRSGDFHVDDKGLLVNSNGDHVQGLDAQGQLTDINVNSFARGTPKATSAVRLAGNLTSTVSTPSVDITVKDVQIYDANGVSHPVDLTFKNNGNGDYGLTVAKPDGTTITISSLKFSAGFPTSATSLLTFDYQPDGGSKTSITLDFSQGVTSLAQTSTLAASSQDGYEAGTKVDQTIGSDGVVTIHYSNGQTGEGGRLALADFRTERDLEEIGGSMFVMNKDGQVQYGAAGSGSYGSLLAGHREGSNVDMAEEFSNLILMQRGYQASSHVISTANDMIQELFDMKGHR